MVNAENNKMLVGMQIVTLALLVQKKMKTILAVRLEIICVTCDKELVYILLTY